MHFFNNRSRALAATVLTASLWLHGCGGGGGGGYGGGNNPPPAPPPPAAPTITLDPLASTNVNRTLALTATATAGAGVSKVEFFVDGTSIASVAEAAASASGIAAGCKGGCGAGTDVADLADDDCPASGWPACSFVTQ